MYETFKSQFEVIDLKLAVCQRRTYRLYSIPTIERKQNYLIEIRMKIHKIYIFAFKYFICTNYVKLQ